ncbi:MAG: hypothetical protein IJQ99_08700 [Synergistaceae bacterium]|nr:hypothetical protein [Synergistaceae bacterium]
MTTLNFSSQTAYYDLAKMFQFFLASLKITVSLFTEDDNSVTGIVDELDLVENAPSKEECITSLIKEMKNYAEDFYNEFEFWSLAPNRKNHIIYVLKILTSTEQELRESIECQNGKS